MKQTKIIAFYLPQYYETPENNRWWGDGFTEWTNVKKARPLFAGHIQPKVPLDENYYCLLDEDIPVWQANLAKRYGIYGFCYYHYWFNGKKMLEQPLENMLKNPAVRIPFCISWANESWTRTWTGKASDVLLPQSYGGPEDWAAHIEYLLPFFRDPRYIKKDGKPVLLLYRAAEIPGCDEMVRQWEICLKRNGFAGLYLIETLSGNQPRPRLRFASAQAEMEPMLAVKKSMPFRIRLRKHLIIRWKLWRFGILDLVDYERIWKSILRRPESGNRNRYRGAFCDWDNSPRRQKKGMIVRGATPAAFERFLTEQLLKSRAEGKEFLFLNAWNEWGEGAYLEPDLHNGFGYLEAVRRAVKNAG